MLRTRCTCFHSSVRHYAAILFVPTLFQHSFGIEASLESEIAKESVCIWHVNFLIIFWKHGNCVCNYHMLYIDLPSQSWEWKRNIGQCPIRIWIKYSNKIHPKKDSITWQDFDFSTSLFPLIWLKWFPCDLQLSPVRHWIHTFKMKSRNIWTEWIKKHTRHYDLDSWTYLPFFRNCGVYSLPRSFAADERFNLGGEIRVRLKKPSRCTWSLTRYFLLCSARFFIHITFRASCKHHTRSRNILGWY